MLEKIDGCLIIPTYNNAATLKRVLDGALFFGANNKTIVINDGSTDGTSDILEAYTGKIILLNNTGNRGKGFSLRRGFAEAISRGFENAITLDSDGQHFPDDIPAFVEAAEKFPGRVIMGSRDLDQETVPGKSSFGNRFSSFWFWVHSGIRLPDTQTGYRLYPLAPLQKIRLYTSRFETEIEVLVKLAWQGVRFVSIPIHVKYDPEERISHFRPFRDVFRITLLNTWFFFQTIGWYLPRRKINSVLKEGVWKSIRTELWKSDESDVVKAASIGFGFFMGIVPIWGFQLLVGFPVAIAMRLNKALFFLAANISIPPMIPLIIYGSYKMGELFLPGQVLTLPTWKGLTLETIYLHFVQYAAGAVALATLTGVTGFFLTLLLIKISAGARKK